MISIIFPTIRPELYLNALKSIQKTREKIEIVIVADFPPPDETPKNVVWHLEMKRQGTIQAINKGFELSKGEYIFIMNDESKLSPNCLDGLLRSYVSLGRQAVISPYHIPFFGFYYYHRFFAAFPFTHRSVIESLWYDPITMEKSKERYFFDPAYKSFYADPDLSLKAHQQGIAVSLCDEVAIYHSNDIGRIDHKENVKNHLIADRALFRKRWDHLGEFKDP